MEPRSLGPPLHPPATGNVRALLRAAVPVVLALAIATGPSSARAQDPAPPDVPPAEPHILLPPTAKDRQRLWQKFRNVNNHPLYPGLAPARPNHARAMVELLAILAFETGIYYAIAPTQKQDWDTRFDDTYVENRLFSLKHVRFDNNAFWYNNFSHPLLGSFYYQVARTNDLGPGPALALTFLGAAAWEYVCEIKEKVSINDIVTTTGGGMALGETVAQLGAFFDRGSGSWVHRSLSLLLSPTRALHDRLDKVPRRRAERLDALGLPADVSHRFELGIGWALTRTTTSRTPRPAWRNDATLALDLRLVNVLGAGAPGRFRNHLTEGNVSRLATTIAFGDRGLRDFTFLSRAGIVGGYTQEISEDASGDRHGFSVYFGGASSFDLSIWDGAGLLDPRQDLWSNTGLLGPLLMIQGFTNGWTLSSTFEAYPTFSLVRSLALPCWQPGQRLDRIPSVLALEGYYFAFGLAALGEVRAGYRGFEATASFRFDTVWSLNGADRFQERILDDIAPRDRRLVFGARLAYGFPATPVRLGVSVLRRMRTGVIRDTVVERADTILAADLDLVF